MYFRIAAISACAMLVLCEVFGVGATQTGPADSTPIVTTRPATEGRFSFVGSAQGWVADQRPDSDSRGIVRATPAVRDGGPVLDLEVALDASDARRRKGECYTLLHGRIRRIELELFIPPGLLWPLQTPPGAQLFVRDASIEQRSCYGPWLNIGNDQWGDYPLQPGQWNRISFAVPLGDSRNPNVSFMAAGFDVTRCMIVGLKVALSPDCAPDTRLRATFAIRNVRVELGPDPPTTGRYVNMAAQAADLATARALRKTSATLPQTQPVREPLGPQRPYFFTDPAWNAAAWTDGDIGYVNRDGQTSLLIKSDFRCRPDSPAAFPSRQGYVQLAFEPNLTLDDRFVSDSRLAADIWCESEDGTFPGPNQLVAKLCVFSRSAGAAPERSWQFSPAISVGGVGRTRLEWNPVVATDQRPPAHSQALGYSPWPVRANRAILFVGLHFYANSPWKGNIRIANFRLGGQPRQVAGRVSGLVQAGPDGFTLDGKPFAVRGANVSFLTQKSPYAIDRTLAEIARNGYSVVRAWGFADGTGLDGRGHEGYCLQPQPGRLDEASFRHLDYFLSCCELHGLRPILPTVNFWSDFQRKDAPESCYGGVGAYMAWAGVPLQYDKSGWLVNRHEFFTNARCRALYRDYLRKFVNRTNVYTGRTYAQSPIFAFELINEPRPFDHNELVGASLADRTALARRRCSEFADWATEMARFLKIECGVKPLVAIGDEGFLSPLSAEQQMSDPALRNGPGALGYGVDWAGALSISGIDFGTVHAYPEHWGWTAVQVEAWIRQHIQLARRAGKPVLFEEWGLMDFTPRPGEDARSRRVRRQAAFDVLKAYGEEHARSNPAGDPESDFAVFHPNLKVLSHEPTGLADEPVNPARRPIYLKWAAMMGRGGNGWLLWQAVAADNDDRPLFPPRECDRFSLSLGHPPHEQLLRDVAAGHLPEP